MKTTIPSNPRPTKPIAELAHGGRALTTCPDCGKPGFYTGKPWQRKGDRAARFRTRRCRFCGHARTERVTSSVEDAAPVITDTGVQFEFTG